MANKKRYGILHFIVFLWGCTPILGKLIHTPALNLVFWRLIFAASSIYIFMRIKGVRLNFTQNIKYELATGIIVGLHWYTFYEAIKVSNVTACLIGFSTITLFASILQPIILKTKFYIADLIYGVVLMLTIVLLMYRNGSLLTNGILIGMVSAFLGALFSIINAKLVHKSDPISLTLSEFIGALICIGFFRILMLEPIQNWSLPMGWDLFYIIIFSVICTSLTFVLSIEVLSDFDPLTIILTNNLEIVYGIVFSWILFQENKSFDTFSYVAISGIILAVFSYPPIKQYFVKQRLKA